MIKKIKKMIQFHFSTCSNYFIGLYYLIKNRLCVISGVHSYNFSHGMYCKRLVYSYENS